MLDRKAQAFADCHFPLSSGTDCGYNPGMSHPSLPYTPSFDDAAVQSGLQQLLVPGPLRDDDLERRSIRLTGMFSLYATFSPHGLWAPGLVLTHGMRSLAEQCLPVAEIVRSLERMIVRSLRVSPVLAGSVIRNAATWLDLLDQLQPLVRHPDPGRLLRELMADDGKRRRFLWRIFLPPRYGCDFDRYPAQGAVLRNWLSRNRLSAGSVVRCLDAACGTGEGTYELARIVHEAVAGWGGWRVDGTTLEPLELFSAAHGYFPHDPERQAAFRSRVAPLLTAVPAKRLSFRQGDLTLPAPATGHGYRIIVCNGVLGGPLLHEKRQLTEGVANLVALLEPGGILLAADRFHGGWKKRVSHNDLRDLLVGGGLQPLAVEDGVAGVRPLA
ncbi:class I SAM-dependent methyltransferase [Geomobilimonas luticola]|nr:chemotaxis protein CheR [Geomobilimonas luticola]